LAVYESLLASQAVLAADTIIALDGEIIGKPESIQHAKSILQKLSAVEHEVLTALCLKTQNNNYEMMVKTKVKFRQLNNSEIDVYCLSDEPYDKAGAYAIQGLASSFVEYISGSYTNVMGLPLADVCSLLKQADLYNFDV
jgi:septum formation protein